MKKIKEVIEKYKTSTDKKKVENAIFLLVMLVIVIIGINVIWFQDNIPDDNIKQDLTTKLQQDNDISVVSEDELEEKLEKILEKVKGVTNVNVLVTYKKDKQIVPIYNTQNVETITNETDTSGGNRNISEKSYNSEIVFEENSNSKSIVVQTEISPEISGVIVVADFSNSTELKQQIITAVAVATGISEYKVQILNGG